MQEQPVSGVMIHVEMHEDAQAVSAVFTPAPPPQGRGGRVKGAARHDRHHSRRGEGGKGAQDKVPAKKGTAAEKPCRKSRHPGQSGGRPGRSTDINLTKLDWVTREALTQGKRVYRVDVDFTNAFNAMSQAALWAVMRAYGIPEGGGGKSRSQAPQRPHSHMARMTRRWLRMVYSAQTQRTSWTLSSTVRRRRCTQTPLTLSLALFLRNALVMHKNKTAQLTVSSFTRLCAPSFDSSAPPLARNNQT